MAIEQIHQTVVVLRNQNGHALTHIRSRQTPLHAEPSCSFSELPGEIADRKIKLCRVELHAHQESVGVVVAVLVRMQDVTAVLRDESGNGGDDALAVGAAEEKYGGFLHYMDSSGFVSGHGFSRAESIPANPVYALQRIRPLWFKELETG